MKARGRPPIDEREPPARVHVTVCSVDYDRAFALAQRKGISVPELARRGLARVLADADEDE